MDEAVLQSYLDGELSPDMASETRAHVAACPACARSLREAEAELAMFSAAFAPESSLSVPSEALRARLNVAVAGLEKARAAERKNSGWSLSALVASLGSLLTVAPQRAVAFASLVAVVAFALAFGLTQLRPDSPRTEVVNNEGGQTPVQVSPNAGQPNAGQTAGQTSDSGPVVEIARVEDSTPAPSSARANGHAAVVKVRSDRKFPRKTPVTTGGEPIRRPGDEAPLGTLPGEEGYQKAIASLNKVIELGGESLMKPSLRADYERNLAVVDRAIDETRRAALRNPKDKETLSFLASAYQSKIDLLSTVADRAQVATLGR